MANGVRLLCKKMSGITSISHHSKNVDYSTQDYNYTVEPLNKGYVLGPATCILSIVKRLSALHMFEMNILTLWENEHLGP